MPPFAPAAGIAGVVSRELIEVLLEKPDVAEVLYVLHPLLPPALIPGDMICTVPDVNSPAVGAVWRRFEYVRRRRGRDHFNLRVGTGADEVLDLAMRQHADALA